MIVRETSPILAVRQKKQSEKLIFGMKRRPNKIASRKPVAANRK
jgi:hypothetical protein